MLIIDSVIFQQKIDSEGAIIPFLEEMYMSAANRSLVYEIGDFGEE